MIDKLKRVVATLNSVEVHGKNNMDYLLGSVLTLESIIRELEDAEKADARALEKQAEGGET